jgi:hypothetical protein
MASSGEAQRSANPQVILNNQLALQATILATTNVAHWFVICS